MGKWWLHDVKKTQEPSPRPHHITPTRLHPSALSPPNPNSPPGLCPPESISPGLISSSTVSPPGLSLLLSLSLLLTLSHPLDPISPPISPPMAVQWLEGPPWSECRIQLQKKGRRWAAQGAGTAQLGDGPAPGLGCPMATWP